jgi:four helix bundle protein
MASKLIEKFEDIKAWQLSRALVREIYAVSASGAFSKDFGLKDQIRRAAGSVMHNIADGFDSGSRAEFARFLRYSQRSSTEIMSQLYIALDQKYITEDQFNQLRKLAKETHATIGGFIKHLQSKAR